jgi:hypothetical protein
MNGKTAKLLRKVAQKIPTDENRNRLYRNMKANWNKLDEDGRTQARRSFKRFLEEVDGKT